MANKSDNAKNPELFTIEELKAKHKTPESVFQGTKIAEGWRMGKMVSEEEYQRVVETFLKQPMNGKEAKKNETKRR